MSLTTRAKTIVPKPVWTILKSGKRAGVRSLQKALGILGLNVSQRRDFYSPLPVIEDLRSTELLWKRPSLMSGVRFDLDAMERRLVELEPAMAEFASLPSYEGAKQAGFGPGFPRIDALILYALLRKLKPHRYIEIGSGLSTYYCSLAAARNQTEGRHLEIQCIEPYPYPSLRSIPGISIRVSKVQEVPLSEFQQLQSGDILFIDSSHALKIGSDVAFLLLETLPSLKPGVWIHLHDVPFPFNIPYPPDFWIYERNWPVLWNEAMAIQAFLAFNNAFDIHLSLPLLRSHRQTALRELVPGYSESEINDNICSSLWIQRVA